MIVDVDGSRCQAHNRCWALAPQLFTLDDVGYARPATTGPLTPAQLEHARLAAANCPERAIRLVAEVPG